MLQQRRFSARTYAHVMINFIPLIGDGRSPWGIARDFAPYAAGKILAHNVTLFSLHLHLSRLIADR